MVAIRNFSKEANIFCAEPYYCRNYLTLKSKDQTEIKNELKNYHYWGGEIFYLLNQDGIYPINNNEVII